LGGGKFWTGLGNRIIRPETKSPNGPKETMHPSGLLPLKIIKNRFYFESCYPTRSTINAY
jgi:hypothetical protein